MTNSRGLQGDFASHKADGGNRTPGKRITNAPLYQTELHQQIKRGGQVALPANADADPSRQLGQHIALAYALVTGSPRCAPYYYTLPFLSITSSDANGVVITRSKTNEIPPA